MICVKPVLLITLLLYVLLAVYASSATYVQTTEHILGDEPWQHYNQSEYQFTAQLVDHFSLDDQRVYSQRYFVVSDFWSAPTAPVLFLLCGEYTCPGVMTALL